MQAMPLLTAGTLIFIALSLAIQVLRPALWEEPTSSGLTGKWHLILDAGFAALAAALFYLGIVQAHAGYGFALCAAWAAGLGICGAAATDSFRKAVERYTGFDDAQARVWHLHSATLAFVGAGALEALLLHERFTLLRAAALAFTVGAPGIVWLVRRDLTWLQEKLGELGICAALLLWSLGR